MSGGTGPEREILKAEGKKGNKIKERERRIKRGSIEKLQDEESEREDMQVDTPERRRTQDGRGEKTDQRDKTKNVSYLYHRPEEAFLLLKQEN